MPLEPSHLVGGYGEIENEIDNLDNLELPPSPRARSLALSLSLATPEVSFKRIVTRTPQSLPPSPTLLLLLLGQEPGAPMLDDYHFPLGT